MRNIKNTDNLIYQKLSSIFHHTEKMNSTGWMVCYYLALNFAHSSRLMLIGKLQV
jgi:hypothetical protein